MNSDKTYLPVIKIGKQEHQVKAGDYLLDNGASIQLASGDRRILAWSGYTKLTALRLSKRAVKEIDFSKLRKIQRSNGLIEYYF